MANYHLEIEQALRKLPMRTSKQIPEAYIGGGQSSLRYIGLRVPQLREVSRKGFSFSENSQFELAKIWDSVWTKSDCYEVLAIALDWFNLPAQREFNVKFWPKLKNWSKRIDNWAHADSLCGIYAHILEVKPDAVYPTLVKWNNSKNPWLRRLSLVSLLYYFSGRSRVLPFKKMITLVENQLSYDHYYVQKGVGWTLRELGNAYPKETDRFLEKNILAISAVAYSAAIEKLPKARREYLKNLRKRK